MQNVQNSTTVTEKVFTNEDIVPFGKNVSKQVRRKIGRDDRRNGSVPRSTDHAYLQGFRDDKKQRRHRPYPTAKESLAMELIASGGELDNLWFGDDISNYGYSSDIAA